MDKCQSCNQYDNCEYLQKGEICPDDINSTFYETTCEFFKGRTAELVICENDFDVRLDLTIDKKKVGKVWGQVKDDTGKCVENALVTLLEPKYVRGYVEYFPIATTLSDCMGFYQFQIAKLEAGLKYRVNVAKS